MRSSHMWSWALDLIQFSHTTKFFIYWLIARFQILCEVIGLHRWLGNFFLWEKKEEGEEERAWGWGKGGKNGKEIRRLSLVIFKLLCVILYDQFFIAIHIGEMDILCYLCVANSELSSQNLEEFMGQIKCSSTHLFNE